jgi:phage portal protein BeeE
MLGKLARRRDEPADVDRSQLSFNQYLSLVEPWLSAFQPKAQTQERANRTITGMALNAYAGNGVVYACASFRLGVFSEVEFALQNNTTKALYTTSALQILQRPWFGATSADLLARMEQDATTAGNSYWFNTGSFVRFEPQLARLDPANVTIMLEPIVGPDGTRLAVRKSGYMHAEPNQEGEFLRLEEVAHYAPMPDPNASYRGMSWLTPVLSDVEADNSLNTFKQSHIDNQAVPGVAIVFDNSVTPEKLEQFKAKMTTSHSGARNAGKTMYLGGGADIKVVGSSFNDLALKAVQGAGETRIAAASGVGAVVASLSEGMQGSSLNSGNYTAARRRVADGTLRPLWRSAVGALSPLVDVPGDSRLWFDDRSVSFLQEDVRDEADIRAQHAATIRNLIDAGFSPDATVAATTTGNLASLTGTHSGLFSVQLQEPGTTAQEPT